MGQKAGAAFPSEPPCCMVAARRYISGDRIDMELERAVGRGVRAFDPCIACATY